MAKTPPRRSRTGRSRSQSLNSATYNVEQWHKVTKKPSTIATDRGRIERHIKPLLGKQESAHPSPVRTSNVFFQVWQNGKTSADVKTCLRGRAIVTWRQRTAARTVGLLGGIFSYAFDCGLIDANPVRGVKRFADKKGERFLSQLELVALGQALRDGLERGLNPQAIAILKLLIFTGARKGEIETLRWNEVDFDGGYLRLAETARQARKRYRSMRALCRCWQTSPV